jgi:hypothetical protein
MPDSFLYPEVGESRFLQNIGTISISKLKNKNYKPVVSESK